MVRYIKSAGMLMVGLVLLGVCIANVCSWMEAGQLPVHSRVFGTFLVSWRSDPVMFVWQIAFNGFLLYYGSLIVIGVALRRY
jgi:hypothetical protein